MYTEEQYEEFTNMIETQFPLMFVKPYGGVAVNTGWWPIIESLCINIQSHIDWWNLNRKDRPVVAQVVIEQIKEKFGGLRFYYQGGDDTIAGMVRMAESWADATCEQCGKPGVIRNGNWIRTLCDEHEADRQALIEKQARKDGLEL